METVVINHAASNYILAPGRRRVATNLELPDQQSVASAVSTTFDTTLLQTLLAPASSSGAIKRDV
jgi:hypothetical protein